MYNCSRPELIPFHLQNQTHFGEIKCKKNMCIHDWKSVECFIVLVERKDRKKKHVIRFRFWCCYSYFCFVSTANNWRLKKEQQIISHGLCFGSSLERGDQILQQFFLLSDKHNLILAASTAYLRILFSIMLNTCTHAQCAMQ